MPAHKSVRELKAEMWQWMEAVNSKEKLKLVDPNTQIVDENQDNLISI